MTIVTLSPIYIIIKNIDKSPEWFNRMKENTQPTIDKRLDESIREILKSTNNAVSNSKYNYESKNGKLIIKYNKKKENDFDIAEKFGYILLFCLIVCVLTFILTHLYYLSFFIILVCIIFLLIPFNCVVNPVKKAFFSKIVFPFMIATCLITTAISWSRMNNMYETNANVKKEQITKVHENIPYWVYDFKPKKVEKNK